MRNRFHGANGNSYHFAYFCQRSSSTEDDEWMSKASGAEKANRPKTSILFKIHWRRVVLDEGHNIKNHKCMTSMAVCRLEAESRWAVTGTPIQNDTIDLYSIIKYLHCSPFDELKVWKRWVDDKSPRGTARMNTLVKSLLLRRTKHQVDATGKPLVSLPDRQVLVHSIKLSKDEQEVYNLVSLYSKNMLTMFLQEKQDKSSGHTSSIRASASQLDPSLTGTQHPDFRRVVIGRNFKDLLIMFTLLNRPVNAGAILLMVLRLRQCCSHLSLMCELLSEDEQKDEGIELPLEEQLQNLSLCDTDESKTHEERQDRPSQLKTSFVSTKISELLRYLNDLRCQSKSERPIKSVVVSQWTRMLEVVAYHLRKNGFKYDFIVGSTPPKKRAEIVEKFNIEPFGSQVMLVSLKAGGVGLNLIGGNHLFLLDQHWNPALEDQAADRIYRVGQKKDVVIHRFLCNETIEEKIVDLQKKKQLLADNVLKGGKGKKQNLTLEDLKMLFGV